MAKLQVKKSYHYKGQEMTPYVTFGDSRIFLSDDMKTLIIADVDNPESKHIVFSSKSEIDQVIKKPF